MSGRNIMSMYGIGPSVDWPPKEEPFSQPLQPIIPVIPVVPQQPFDISGARLQKDGMVLIPEEELRRLLNDKAELQNEVNRLTELLKKVEELVK